MTVTVVGIAGSLRRGSYNAALLQAAAARAPATCRVEVASIAGIPLYDGDVEQAAGIPEVVVALKERIAAADGLLLVTPEYNNSVPGVLKNAIDWLSRPSRDIRRVFGRRPVGLIGATPGVGGTRLAQTAWLPVLRALGTQPWFERSLYVASAEQVFDGTGQLVDARVEQALVAYMEGFTAFVERAR